MLQHVSDNLGVVEALAGGGPPRSSSATTGAAPIAANSALLRPDVSPRSPCSVCLTAPRASGGPTDAFAEMGSLVGQGEEFYINYFQEPGRAEREAEIDVRSWLPRLLRRGVRKRGAVGVREGVHRHRGSRHNAARPIPRH